MSGLQQAVRRSVRRAPLSAPAFLLATVWKCCLAASNWQSVQLFAEDWARKLALMRSFLLVQRTYTQLQVWSVLSIEGCNLCFRRMS